MVEDTLLTSNKKDEKMYSMIPKLIQPKIEQIVVEEKVENEDDIEAYYKKYEVKSDYSIFNLLDKFEREFQEKQRKKLEEIERKKYENLVFDCLDDSDLLYFRPSKDSDVSFEEQRLHAYQFFYLFHQKKYKQGKKYFFFFIFYFYYFYQFKFFFFQYLF